VAKSLRKNRNPHPGVYLKTRKVKDGVTWRAQYNDPDTGKTIFESLEPYHLRTDEARRQWAIRKSEQLAKRRAGISTGAISTTKTPIEKAASDYMALCEARGKKPEGDKGRLAPKTIESYRSSIEDFKGWTAQKNILYIESVTKGQLAEFADSIKIQKKRVPARNRSRGTRKKSEVTISNESIRTKLRGVKTFLRHFSRYDLLKLSTDVIAGSIVVPKGDDPVLHILYPAECRKLLEAAIRHDSDTFKLTKEEKARLRPAGTTLKYDPVAPLTLFLLLTGCRRGEAYKLQWDRIFLDAVDVEGQKVGEIRLRKEDTKNKKARIIGLDVSPSLRSLLAAMRLKKPNDIYVFGGDEQLRDTEVKRARERLVNTYGAPEGFTWKHLRQTASSFGSSAPSIYGAAAPFMSAKRLGHSTTVADKHYAQALTGLCRDARTFEAAMQIEDLAREIVALVSGEPVLVAPVIKAVG
jgi:integrase